MGDEGLPSYCPEPIDPKLAAEPLQSVNGKILKQLLRRFNRFAQAPPDHIFELLQRDLPGTALLMNTLHQFGRGNCRTARHAAK